MTHDPDPSDAPFRPGVYFDVPESVYHADPAGRPSLSSSVGKLLLSHSPRHAWHAHPRLNPEWVPDDPAKFDFGKAVHALLLDDRPERLQVIDAADYRTNAAKAARDAALAAGRVPLLAEQHQRAIAVVQSARDAIPRFKEGADFLDGVSEATLVWSEPGGVMCRARIDRMARDCAHLFDVKTEGESAHPDAFANKIARLGYDFSAAFYLRGFRACFPGHPQPQWSWLAIETDPPHGVSLTGLDETGFAIADQQVEVAIAMWRECMTRGEWPGYPYKKRVIETKPWAITAAENLGLRLGNRPATDSQAVRDMMLAWQAPVAGGGS